MHWILLAAFLTCVAVVWSYYSYFHMTLNYPLSLNPEVWAQFADFIGGLLGPLLTFFSLVFLVHSLNLQRKANTDLREEINRNKKDELVKSFEAHLFNMINSQSNQLENFSLTLNYLGQETTYSGSKAIIELERDIELISEVEVQDSFISEYIEDVDEVDKIFSSIRSFYIIIKLIDEKLSDKNGFNKNFRKEYYATVIGYTDFALIRLILMSIQFVNCAGSNYLKSNLEFKEQIEDFHLSFELYNR